MATIDERGNVIGTGAITHSPSVIPMSGGYVPTPAPTSTPGYFSSANGAKLVNQAQQTQTRITTPPALGRYAP